MIDWTTKSQRAAWERIAADIDSGKWVAHVSSVFAVAVPALLEDHARLVAMLRRVQAVDVYHDDINEDIVALLAEVDGE